MKKQTLILSTAFGLALTTGAFAQDFCNATHTGTPKTVTFNSVAPESDKGETNPIGDYHYEQWIKSGSASAKFYPDGSFSCSFSNADDYLCREGVFYGKNSGKDPLSVGHLVADYSMSEFKNAGGISYAYVGVYGWMQDPLIEWYIVDNWGPASRPTWVGGEVDKTPFKTVTIDGAQYDLYRNSANRATIDGYKPFDQIYSVRKTAKKCGSIDITAHFQAWKDAGITLGTSLYEAKILGEAGQYPENHGANGSIDFNYAKVYVVDGPLSSSSATPTSSSSVNAARTPYSSNALPGTLEFENFDKGSNTYSVGGEPADYCSARSDAPEVCIIGTGASDGLGGLEPGDWFEYTIVVDKHASYSFEVLACSGAETDRTLTLSIDGKNVGEATLTAVADDWETFSKSTGKTIELAPGTYVLRVETDGYVNLDNIKFEVAELSAISAQRLQVVAKSSLQVFDAMGKFLGKVDMKDAAALDAALKANFHKSGIYLVKQGNFVQRVNVK